MRAACFAFSTTFFMSPGARNWPFLMFTGLPVAATAEMKSVWRQRNAGVCSTSTMAAAASISSSSCTSVNTGTPSSLRTAPRISRPLSMPSPRKDLMRAAIRLVVGRLVDERDAERGGDLLQLAGGVEGELARFDHAGARYDKERAIQSDFEAAQVHQRDRFDSAGLAPDSRVAIPVKQPTGPLLRRPRAPGYQKQRLIKPNLEPAQVHAIRLRRCSPAAGPGCGAGCSYRRCPAPPGRKP